MTRGSRLALASALAFAGCFDASGESGASSAAAGAIGAGAGTSGSTAGSSASTATTGGAAGATAASSGGGGTAGGTSTGGGCVIDGTSYAAAQVDPANGCAACLPSVSASDWTPVTDGSACDGGVCQNGACLTGVCLIDGVIYQGFSYDPEDLCAYCRPPYSATMWDYESVNGTYCGDGGTLYGCQEGACIFGCPAGPGTQTLTAGESGPCNICEPSAATEPSNGFVYLSNGTPCDAGEPGAYECQETDCLPAN